MSDAPKKRYYRGGKQLIEKYAAERNFHSVHEFSRFLHSVEPARTVHGWRNAILRWQKAGGVVTYAEHSANAARFNSNEPARLPNYFFRGNISNYCLIPSKP